VLFPSQVVVDGLSSRIQEAYGLRQPDWRGACSTARVWNAAAERLWTAHAADPARVPLDAELFVASQPIGVPFADPWSELTQPESARRYRSTLRRIIRRLRHELKREVARTERLITRGRDICELLEKGKRISPLGCFIVAVRAGRAELANRFTAAAAAQHRACPLFREASDALLATDLYPAEAHYTPHAVEPDLNPRVERLLLSLN
jgi:hypothetical protein